MFFGEKIRKNDKGDDITPFDGIERQTVILKKKGVYTVD
jgi:hypothetical protein